MPPENGDIGEIAIRFPVLFENTGARTMPRKQTCQHSLAGAALANMLGRNETGAGTRKQQ